ncbi:hypothetical protein [Aquimarina sp. SS2-1]|uniref:hypothetical protein n=1 Tax=Aquimarina besae TaxID=3342247 RepID=UPI00366CB22F
MKKYRPTLLYIVKIFGLIIGAAVAVFIVSLFLDVISFLVQSSIFEKSVAIFLIFLLVVAAFLIIRSNNPAISLDDNYIIIGRQQIQYDQIKAFYAAKGGSEPYIIINDGTKIDLEISWFSKKDRSEIEKTILEKIESRTKQT